MKRKEIVYNEKTRYEVNNNIVLSTVYESMKRKEIVYNEKTRYEVNNNIVLSKKKQYLVKSKRQKDKGRRKVT